MIKQLTDRALAAERIRIACLICLHTVICCVSLIYAADATFQVSLDPAPFHIFYDPARLPVAIAVVRLCRSFDCFLFCPFQLRIRRRVLFLHDDIGISLVKLLHRPELRSQIVGAFRGRIGGDVSSSGAVHRVADTSGLRDVGRCVRPAADGHSAAGCRGGDLGRALQFPHCRHCGHLRFRDRMESPAIVNYSVAIASGALLPFAFAGFIFRKAYWKASAALLLFCSFIRSP